MSILLISHLLLYKIFFYDLRKSFFHNGNGRFCIFFDCFIDRVNNAFPLHVIVLGLVKENRFGISLIRDDITLTLKGMAWEGIIIELVKLLPQFKDLLVRVQVLMLASMGIGVIRVFTWCKHHLISFVVPIYLILDKTIERGSPSSLPYRLTIVLPTSSNLLSQHCGIDHCTLLYPLPSTNIDPPTRELIKQQSQSI